MRPVCKADNLINFLCRCHEIWNPLGHSRSVTGLLCIFLLPYRIVDFLCLGPSDLKTGYSTIRYRSRCPRGLRRASAAARLLRIAGLSPAGGINVFLLCLRPSDHRSGGVLPSVVCLSECQCHYHSTLMTYEDNAE